MGSGDDCAVAIIYRPVTIKKSDEIEQPEKIETTITETPSEETSPATAALTDSETVAPEDLEDVTVTITIKKDKNKTSNSSSVALAEKDSALPTLNNSSD